MQFTRFSLAALALCLFSTAAAGAAQPEPPAPGTAAISREKRIWAQTRIEQVYYNHRLWPKENPEPKPSFSAIVPAAVIEKKAMAPLRMCAALKQFWAIEITPAMLQTEMDRMERESKIG